MEENGQREKVKKFLNSIGGAILLFIVLFYALTFGVYYFYSPGPEERRQAELQK